MGKQIQALLGSGADSFKNMYDVSIKFPWDLNTDVPLTVRAQGFNSPKPKVKTYPKKYHGTTIEAVAPEITFERKFDLEFRLDASFNLYGQFVTWFSTVADINSCGVANWAPALGEITVVALSGQYSAINEVGASDSNGVYQDENNNAKWVYKDVVVVGVDQPDFSTESADANKFKVSFIFGENVAPFFDGKNISGE